MLIAAVITITVGLKQDLSDAEKWANENFVASDWSESNLDTKPDDFDEETGLSSHPDYVVTEIYPENIIFADTTRSYPEDRHAIAEAERNNFLAKVKQKITAVPQGGNTYSVFIDGAFVENREADSSFDAAEDWCIANGLDIDDYDVIESD
jgi:hypothetical protein